MTTNTGHGTRHCGGRPHQSTVYIALTALFAILFGILYALTPPGADDLLYLGGLEDAMAEKGVAGGLVDSFALRFHTETGRIGVYISLLLLGLVPKYVSAILMAVSVEILFIIGCRLADAPFGSVRSWLWAGAIIFLLPWYDFMLLTTYMVNYVVGGAFAVTSAYYFMRCGDCRGWRLAGVCLLMFVTGWIHECYGAPLICAAAVVMLANRHSVTASMTMCFAALCAGAAMIALSPVLWSRAASESLLLKFPLKEAMMQLGPALASVALFAVMSLIVFVKGWRGRLMSSKAPILWIFTAVSVAVSLCITLKFYCGPRTAFPVILFSSLGTVYLMGFTTDVRLPDILKTSTKVLIAALGSVNLSYAIVRECGLRHEYADIVRLFRGSPDGTFHYDLSYPSLDLSFFKTSVRDFHSRQPIEMWQNYYDPTGRKSLVILPTEMEGFLPEKARMSANVPGAMIYNGWIVLEESSEIAEHAAGISRITVVRDSGMSERSRYRLYPFTASDGRTYILLIPHVKVLDKSITISDLDIPRN